MLETLHNLDWTLKEGPTHQVKSKVKCGYSIWGEDSKKQYLVIQSNRSYRKNIKVNTA